MSQKREEWPNRPGVSIETMLKAVHSQAELIPGVIDHVLTQVNEAISVLNAQGVTNVFTTGCGDSYFSPMATRLAFEKHSGCRTEAIEALEFSRYTVDYLPEGSLVIGVSLGGTTSRPVEALQQAQRAGAATIAVTGNAQSQLGRHADHVIIHNERSFRVEAPPGEGTFALGGYLASMVTLYLTALELGRARRTLDQASFDAALAEIRRAPGIIEATIEANGAVVREYARSVADAGAYYILGGGPSLATTLFMCAKLFEMPQRNGVAIELEEWAHEQYFLTRADTPVLVVAPPGSSLDRAREQMRGARDMGGRVVAICDHEDETTKGMADVVFPIVGQLPEEFSPLTYCVPGELFAVELCRALGKPAFAFIEAKQYEVNMRQILRSQLR